MTRDPAATDAPIDFWFDFISPYGYCASLRIDALAARHGRTVRWRPLLLGVTVLKVMGLKPVLETPLKGDYALRELQRYLRRHGITLGRALEAAPMNPLPAGRAFGWLLHHHPELAQSFARQVLHDYWVRGLAMDELARIRDAAVAVGVAPEALDKLGSPEASDLLRASVNAALQQGAFGSPFVVVDGEPFFGVDKFELLDEWLRTGGW